MMGLKRRKAIVFPAAAPVLQRIIVDFTGCGTRTNSASPIQRKVEK